MSHVACHMSNAYVDPWDMLNNYCFHVSAQMLMFMGEMTMVIFLPQQHRPEMLKPASAASIASVKKSKLV